MAELHKSAFLSIFRKKKSWYVFNTVSRKFFAFDKLDHPQSLITTKNYRKQILDYFSLKEKANNKRLVIYYTVTSKCDLECSYCFENHLVRGDSQLKDILFFIKLLDKKIRGDRKIKKIELILFGGEPLLRSDLCLILLTRVKKLCQKHNLQYLFSMASNGIMADKIIMATLKKAGLTHIQITFDGARSSHDQIRKTKLGGYRKLIKNISWLSKSFKLTLKYNLRKQNVSDFLNFIKDVKKLHDKNITVKLEALQPTLTDKKSSVYFSYESPKLADVYCQLAETAAKSGVKVDISSSLKPPCMVSAKNSFMVEPDGDISACVSAYKITDLSLGNLKYLKNLILDRKKIKKIIIKAAASKCIPEKCPYFPICEAGCLFVKSVNNLNLSIPYCRKRYFERLIPGLFILNQYAA